MEARISEALELSLGSRQWGPADAGAIALARAYARECDVTGVRAGRGESDPGVGLLTVLKALNLTPQAAKAIVSPEGGKDDAGSSPLASLRDAARARRAANRDTGASA